MPEIKKNALAEVRTLLDTRKNMIEQLLDNSLDMQRFMQLAVRLCEKTPALLECTPVSVAGAIIEAAELKLPLGAHLGYAWLVPYKDRKRGVTRAVFIPGYRGLVELCRRSGHVLHIWADVVRDGDSFSETRGDFPELEHIPLPLDERTDEYLSPDRIRGAYAVAKLTNGTLVHRVLARPEIEAVRKRSPAGSYGPWVTDYPAMAMKTAIRRLCPTLPLSPDDMRVVSRDEAFDQGREPDLSEVEWEAEPEPETSPDATITLSDLDASGPTPISEDTYTALREATADLTADELTELLDSTTGIADMRALSEEDGKKVLQRVAAGSTKDS